MSTEVCISCGQPISIGSWPFCPHGIPYGGTLLASIHPSERTVIYRNPRTGEHRTPARNDMPMPEVYARQGYVREELSTHRDVKRFQRETGLVHERSHYDPGSGRAERDNAAEPEPYKRDPDLTHKLVQHLRS